MTTRALAIPLLALALALLLATACDGGDDGERPAGRLTDPRSVPTATPWAVPPAPIILDPGALTPISETGTEEPGVDGEVSDEVTPVTPFLVTVDDSANRRELPSTESGIVGIINAGDEETVIGEVRGELVEGGNDLWYQLEDGSFVYSGAVTEVEE
jgi:hypothetical protein